MNDFFVIIISILVLFSIVLFIRDLYFKAKTVVPLKNKASKKVKSIDLIKTTRHLIADLNSLNWPLYKRDFNFKRKIIEKNIEELKKIQKDFSPPKLSLKETFASYYFCEKEKLKKHLILKELYEIMEEEISNLEKENIDFNLNKKVDYYKEIDPNFLKIYNIKKEQVQIYSLTLKVFDEIDEALGAISNAQAMETLDLVSKNKAFSVISSISTSSASSEISDVKNTLNQLKNKINEVKDSEIKDVDDSLDLVFDFCFDSSLDFLSFLNLFSLSSASSSLEDLNRELKKVFPEIEKNKKTAVLNYDKYLSNLS